ncbi:hypothetical protein STRDD11_00468 [Streptococcus sp. DD11]|nr:hypothetical protein STRDD11_00468 [Streptococcus sp. DD11]
MYNGLYLFDRWRRDSFVFLRTAAARKIGGKDEYKKSK